MLLLTIGIIQFLKIKRREEIPKKVAVTGLDIPLPQTKNHC